MRKPSDPKQNANVKGKPPPHGLRQGAYLPHLTANRAVYAVTFRLADSLPKQVMQSWVAESESLSDKQAARRHTERMESLLDAAHGECWLKRPEIAGLIADALRHFDADRYDLHAWCIMPNHVHVVVEPRVGHALPAIVQSWKSYTAKVANRIIKRSGAFWQTEYYDHLVRDEVEYGHAVAYVRENLERAGLSAWPWVWVRS